MYEYDVFCYPHNNLHTCSIKTRYIAPVIFLLMSLTMFYYFVSNMRNYLRFPSKPMKASFLFLSCIIFFLCGETLIIIIDYIGDFAFYKYLEYDTQNILIDLQKSIVSIPYLLVCEQISHIIEIFYKRSGKVAYISSKCLKIVAVFFTLMSSFSLVFRNHTKSDAILEIEAYVSYVELASKMLFLFLGFFCFTLSNNTIKLFMPSVLQSMRILLFFLSFTQLLTIIVHFNLVYSNIYYILFLVDYNTNKYIGSAIISIQTLIVDNLPLVITWISFFKLSKSEETQDDTFIDTSNQETSDILSMPLD